jgi:hypothetical protein
MKTISTAHDSKNTYVNPHSDRNIKNQNDTYTAKDAWRL